MPELRKDPTAGRWIIVATERVRRPSDFSRVRAPRRGGPCALCAGHEHETPPELLAVRDGAEAAVPNGPGWQVRVVPNKFPALRIEGDLERRGQDMYDLMNGVGAHEIVVESPEHDQTLGSMPVEAVEAVLRACRDRIVDLKRDDRLRAMVVFETHGTEAGATLEHPHLQLIAAPVVPFVLTGEIEHARAYHDYRERCLFCDMLRQEIETRSRMVMETRQIVAFAPFASALPFETWILPRRHVAGFEHTEAGELGELARVLRSVLRRLERAIGDPPYTLLLHSAPFGGSESPSFHWHIEIAPALAHVPTLRGGFPLNPMPPEDAARFLRDAGE
jgi:UDPglucose--hexose-1-phosphate uridylyltransferase